MVITLKVTCFAIGENPVEAKETAMDLDEKEMKDSEDKTEDGQNAEQAEKETSEDNGEEDKMEEETKSEENTEHPTENIGEEEEKPSAEDQREFTEDEKEKGIPNTDQGLHHQVLFCYIIRDYVEKNCTYHLMH